MAGGVQPQLEEPILATQKVLGTSVRVGSIVEYKGKIRHVLAIRQKDVLALTEPIDKLTVVEVKIAEGFVPIGDICVKQI